MSWSDDLGGGEGGEQGDVEAPITAVKAALEGALARWSTEFVARYGLDDPDDATPAQAAQEVRVAREIREMFWSLDAVARTDPDVLARTRAQAAALITRELGLAPPVTLRDSPEERALRGRGRGR